MRILHILDHSIPLHSGYTFRTRAILNEQQKLGWETQHLTSPKHNIEAKIPGLEEEVDGLYFYRCPDIDSWMDNVPILNQMSIVKRLEQRLMEVVDLVKPDILHAHSPALNGLAAVRVGKKKNIPVVYEIRAFWEDAAADHGTSKEGGIRYKLTRALETTVIKRANAVTTICEGLRKDIISRNISADKVTVIPNAVDIESFKIKGQSDQELQSKLGLAGNPVIGFIGSFYAYEGLTLLIAAMPLILQQLPNLKLLLVGGGPDDEKLKELMHELGVVDSVIFVGRVPHKEVERYYNLIDLLVYPRLTMRLTELVTPLKPLEAMAQGRLVLASDVGGHHELITDGENGILFEAGNEAQLAERVIQLFQDKDSWATICETAREYVEKQRNWKYSVAKYKAVYGQLASPL